MYGSPFTHIFNLRSAFISALLTFTFNKGVKEVIKILIQNNADVNAKDEYGHTALSSAQGHEDIVDLLLQHQNDIDVNEFWKYFLYGCKLIYYSLNKIIPEKFFKMF